MELDDLIQKLLDIREKRGNKAIKIALYPTPVKVGNIVSVTGYGSTIYIDAAVTKEALYELD